MREVISLNGMSTFPGALEPTRARPPLGLFHPPMLLLMLTFDDNSRPGRLPDCQLVLGGEIILPLIRRMAIIACAVREKGPD